MWKAAVAIVCGCLAYILFPVLDLNEMSPSYMGTLVFPTLMRSAIVATLVLCLLWLVTYGITRRKPAAWVQFTVAAAVGIMLGATVGLLPVLLVYVGGALLWRLVTLPWRWDREYQEKKRTAAMAPPPVPQEGLLPKAPFLYEDRAA